ncbi:hypothetical protein ATN89_17495 [Comamonas thiooxydans]|uniref:hypothetical protein n=1 Tax=Comamonas thiooxydans TaxID=363952 RepID=UPI0007C58439|nr:hypothetical protein [Comamonas thiooxydans]OAD82877.1 hypothetical protein ATN89_17495 [Comamonas thiooxydans]
MKHLKITEAGYEGFSGYFGIIAFKDGISASPVSDIEFKRMQALLRVEQHGDEITDTNEPAVVTLKSAAAAPAPEPLVTVDEKPAAGEAWTRDALEAVADKSGIKGVREIAAPLGVSGKSITDLITGILAAQN